MKTVFLLNHVPDPRINKRIGIAKTMGEVVVICVRRASQDLFEPYYKDVVHEIIDIDLPPSKQFIKRFLASKKYEKQAFDLLLKYSPTIVYTEGMDSLKIAVEYKKRNTCKIIYEVADLRELFIERPKNLIFFVLSSIIKATEKRLVRFVDRLVLTSEKFHEAYYCNIISKEKMIYMPNTPDEGPFQNYLRKNSGEFTVGFIGGVRYMDQMKMLVDAAETVDCKVLFAGGGGYGDYERITDYCKGKENITFTGKYVFDRDIARLYGMVDCVYSVYDADNANVRIALPNKLYEAVLCGLPIIVAKGTYLSEVVEDWGVGVSVSHKDVNELATTLEKMKNDKSFYDRMVQGCSSKSSEVTAAKYNTSLEKVFQML